MTGRSAASWRAFLGRFLLALVLVTGLVAGGIGAAYWKANDTIDQITAVPIAPEILSEDAPGEAANFLLIGSDSREWVQDDLAQSAFGDEGDVQGRRSDTMMIAHVDPKTDTGLLVSFPRDLWVDIPGHGMGKINSAFNLGGAELVIQTLQQNFDLPIQHYLEVDLPGFLGLVDAIGAVDIYFPTPARDKYTGLYAPLAGCYELDGLNALKYVRSRYYEWRDEDGDWRNDPTGDLGRIRRQQYFMRSLGQSAIESGAQNPVRALDILNSTVGFLKRDPSLGFSDLRGLASTFRNVDPGVVEMTTVPADLGRADGQSVLLLRENEAQPLFERLRTFGPPTAAEQPEPLPTIPPSEVSFQVQNGSGVGGAARSATDALAAAGFVAGAPAADADRSDYATTEVRYAAGADDDARLVQAYLGGAGKLVTVDGATLPPGTDVVVVLGSDFVGVSAPGATAPAAAPTTVPAPTTTLPPAPGFPVPATGPDAGRPPVGCP